MLVLTLMIEMALVFLFLLGIRRVFDKTSIGKAKWQLQNTSFSIQSRFLIRMALLSLSWERFAGYILANQGVGRMADRPASFAIAIYFLAYLPTLIFTTALTWILSSSGSFSGLSSMINSETYSQFIYLLLDMGIHGLLLCFGIGFFSALILGRSGLGVILATVFLYPGLISIPGAVLIPVAEMVALSFVYWKQAESSGLAKDVRLRLVSLLLTLALFILLGGFLKDLISIFGENLNVTTRFLKWSFLLALVFATDLIFSLIITHFVFHRTEWKRNISWWPNRFMINHGWQSIDQVNELATEAQDRAERLKQQMQSLSQEEMTRIPAAIRQQHEAEMEKMDYFLRHWEDLQTKV